MSPRARHTVFAILIAAGVAVVGTAPATAGEVAPDVQTQAATAVSTASAVLHGLVNPRGRMTTYWFEYGTTLAYGTTTNPASAGKGDKPVTITSGIAGLEPATTYHLRLVASNDRGVTEGNDVTLATIAANGQGPGAPLPTHAAPSPLPGTELAPAPAAAPCSRPAWRLPRRTVSCSCASRAPPTRRRSRARPPSRSGPSSIHAPAA